MKYYIVDDHLGVIKTLDNIIENEGVGEVIGYETNPKKAVLDIISCEPDIVLVDLLMDEMDGISLVKKVREQRENMGFVMISQVADKEMIGEAYQAGVDYFINKPVNILEVKSVLKKVSEFLENKKTLENIQGLFQAKEAKEVSEEDSLKEIKRLLGLFNMVGEKGTGDILKLSAYLINSKQLYSRKAFEDFCKDALESEKTIEQRMRRAIKKGLTEVATMAIDDYENYIVQDYGKYVFDFGAIREEMNYVKGVSSSSGRVKINKFMDGLLAYADVEKNY